MFSNGSNDGEKQKESTDLTSEGKAFQMVGASTREPWLAIDSFLHGIFKKTV